MRKAIGAIGKSVKTINNFFIAALLFLFYFTVIGLGRVIYQLFGKTGRASDTFWEEPPKPPAGNSWLHSPY